MPTQKTLREIINNLIYQLYVNKNESRTQEEEDIKNEEDINQSLSEIKSLIKEKLMERIKNSEGVEFELQRCSDMDYSVKFTYPDGNFIQSKFMDITMLVDYIWSWNISQFKQIIEEVL